MRTPSLQAGSPRTHTHPSVVSLPLQAARQAGGQVQQLLQLRLPVLEEHKSETQRKTKDPKGVHPRALPQAGPCSSSCSCASLSLEQGKQQKHDNRPLRLRLKAYILEPRPAPGR